jgi:hypothetical protein
MFWNRIKTYYMNHPRTRRPDAFGGDVDLVEDTLDRLSAHADNESATDALDELKS